MPIQLPEVPGLQSTAINAPMMDPRAAMAPYAALGRVGQSFAELGDSFGKIALDMQRLDNRRQVSEQRQALAQSYADFDLELQQDSDPVSRNTRTREFFQQARGRLESLDLPSAVREQLIDSFDDFATKATIRQGQDSARLAVKRSLLAAENELGHWVRGGNYEEADATIGRLQAEGAVLPEEAEKMRQDARTRIAHQQAQRDILADAGGWLERNPDDQVPANYDPDQWSRLHSYAKARHREQVAEDLDTISTAVAAGGITTRQQLEARSSHLPQAAKDRLLNYFDRAGDEQRKAFLQSPAGQQQTIGLVRGLLQDYQPNSDNWQQLTEISTLIAELPDGVAKQRVQALANDRIQGKYQPNTYDDQLFNQLDELRDAGVWGRYPKAEASTVREHLADGYLSDPAKLKRLGFSDDQVAQITGSALSDDERRGWKQQDQVNTFRQLWDQRGKADADVPQFEWQLATAIRDGRDFVDYYDPAAQRQREAVANKHGAAVMQLEDYLRLNPNATPKDKEAKFREITGRSFRQQATQALRPPPATAEGGEGNDRLTPPGNGRFGVTYRTRDRLPSSSVNARQVSLDFNDTASGKAARGVTIVIPANASPTERQAAQDYVDQTVDWFASHGLQVPNLGVKTTTGKGTRVSRFHTEPFFVGDSEAVDIMRRHPEQYARILAGTLGRIEGVTFIAPHKTNDPGASRPGINERDFARQYLLPELWDLTKQPQLD